jgi:hypothetical protein
VYAHFIEWSANLQGTVDRVFEISSPLPLSSRHVAVMTMLWVGEKLSDGQSTEGTEFLHGNILVSINSDINVTKETL